MFFRASDGGLGVVWVLIALGNIRQTHDKAWYLKKNLADANDKNIFLRISRLDQIDCWLQAF